MSTDLHIKGNKLRRDSLPGRFESEEGTPSWPGTMCDSCGGKINLLNKKICSQCSQHFCSKCIQHSTSRSPQTCRKCIVFTSPVMERTQLRQLSISDLKYYVKHNRIPTSLNPSPEDLIDLILSKQAKVLVDRANKAIGQLTNVPQGADFTTLDTSKLMPHVSSYSHPGAGGSAHSGQESMDGAVGGASSVDDGLHIRKKVRKGVDLSTVSNIDDLDSEDDINKLTVKQLKIILQRNCIDYKGCVEKSELSEKVKTLWRAKEVDKKTEAKINEDGDIEAESEFLCKVCMDAPVDCVLLECGHMLTCVRCGRQLAECPICRQYVVRVVHAFKV